MDNRLGMGEICLSELLLHNGSVLVKVKPIPSHTYLYRNPPDAETLRIWKCQVKQKAVVGSETGSFVNKV